MASPTDRAHRAKIIFVIVASVVPATFVGVLLVGYDYFNRERTRLERDATATTRALVAAVDRELTSTRAALQVLATSPYLDSGDLAAFHVQASGVIKQQFLVNVLLISEDGRQLLNTARPFGGQLPSTGDPGGASRVFKTGDTVVSGLFTGRLTGAPVIGVTVPVVRQGKVRYALGASMSPERLSTLLQESRLPPSWIVGIVDAKGTVVARSREAQRFVGGQATTELRRRMGEVAEGAFYSRSLEGISTLTVFTRSPVSGWTVAMGIPERDLTTQLAYSLARLFVIAFIVLAGAVVSAMLLARRMFADRQPVS